MSYQEKARWDDGGSGHEMVSDIFVFAPLHCRDLHRKLFRIERRVENLDENRFQEPLIPAEPLDAPSSGFFVRRGSHERRREH